MKALKWIGIVLGSLIILAIIGFQVLKHQTRKHSPEEVATYSNGDTKIEVVYCSPAVKGREIFGGLVPFKEVWRTGANDATTFTSNVDLLIAGEKLPAGTYTLWTIPDENTWQVLFNKGEYSWGLGFDGKSPRDPNLDIVSVNAPTQELNQSVEHFKIDVKDNLTLTFEWDRTLVVVPMELAP